MYCIPLNKGKLAIEVGGKAKNFNRVESLNIHIPKTIVITRKALTIFLQENDLKTYIDKYFHLFETAKDSVIKSAFSDLCKKIHSATIPNTSGKVHLL